jgi:hypothetical protein
MDKANLLILEKEKKIVICKVMMNLEDFVLSEVNQAECLFVCFGGTRI